MPTFTDLHNSNPATALTGAEFFGADQGGQTVGVTGVQIAALVNSAPAIATQVAAATAQANIATTQAGIASTQAGLAATQVGLATTQASIAAAAVLGLPYYPILNASTTAGGSNVLPQGITSGTVGGTAVTAATPGTYALTPTGGSFTGVAANLVVASATTASIVIVTPGRTAVASPTAPTFANPAGATLPAGTTLTAVIGTQIPSGTGQIYLTTDVAGANLLYWQNLGTGAPVAVNGAGGVQVSAPLASTIALLNSRLPTPIFTFGGSYAMLLVDSVGNGAALPGTAVPATVPLFTFGNVFMVIDGSGNGLPVMTGAQTLDIVKGARRLMPSARSEGLRIICVQSAAFDNTTPQTFQSTIETAQHFDAIRVVFANGGAVPVAVGSSAVSVRADTNPTDNNNAAAWVPVTFSGAVAGSIPAAPGGSRVGYLVSDWIPISSIPRTDGGTGGVLIARAYVSSAASITIPNPYNTNSATRTGGYAFGCRSTAGDCVTTIANFTSTTNITSTPLCGVNYAARGIVACVGAVGDSITFGNADNIQSDGDVVRLAAAMNNQTKIAFDAVNLGWSSTQTPSFFQRYQDFVNAGLRVDVCFYSAGSPNDMGTGVGTVTAAKIGVMRQNRAQALRLMRSQGTVPILWTWGPFGNTYTSGTYFAWGSSDALRVADNVEIVAEGARGFLVADFATALYGSTDGTGQQQPNPAYFGADLVHPNNAGYVLRATISVPVFTAALTA